MDLYLDIRLLPDPEFPMPVLMNALFAKLHRALVQLASSRIGLSFPKVDSKRPMLGECLRLHGSGDHLQQLMDHPWLTGMHDHVALSEMAPVPENTAHRIVRRVQVKSSPERLRRRLMRRKGLSEREAWQAIPDEQARFSSLPFVTLNSQSTGQQFRLFIEHQTPINKPIGGTFNTYGLSLGATVPWF